MCARARAKIAQQLGQHLAHGLRFARELRPVVPVVDRALSKTLARMQDRRAVAADDGDRGGADPSDQNRAPPSDTAPSRRRLPAALARAARRWRPSSLPRQTAAAAGGRTARPRRSASRSCHGDITAQSPVGQVHIQSLEVSRLLTQLSTQATALAADKELRAVLQEERRWLAEARQLVLEVRYFRQSVDHRWPARLRRWALAGVFALATAAAVGAGFGAVTRGDAAEDASFRNRAAFADTILQRLDAMTPAERRQFDRLLKGDEASR